MNPSPKHLSLASIHGIYSGGVAIKREATADEPTKVYTTTKQFARETSHTGTAPTRPLAPGTRYRR
ncbi:hypothetical protein [Dyella sp. 20L07]|uniref:hypothetical protein n=1 Tax=Dyella sp. 20L07 TaxID=3384240 RepID=UPI003D2D9B88